MLRTETLSVQITARFIHNLRDKVTQLIQWSTIILMFEASARVQRTLQRVIECAFRFNLEFVLDYLTILRYSDHHLIRDHRCRPGQEGSLQI